MDFGNFERRAREKVPQLRMNELKELLARATLKRGGNKPVLVERLLAHIVTLARNRREAECRNYADFLGIPLEKTPVSAPKTRIPAVQKSAEIRQNSRIHVKFISDPFVTIHRQISTSIVVQGEHLRSTFYKHEFALDHDDYGNLITNK